MVEQEYRAAGVRSDQVETGAVIVTGEIARAKNAAEILTAVSNLAGDFIVTVAERDVVCIITMNGGTNTLEGGAFVVEMIKKTLRYQASSVALKEKANS